MKRKILLIEPGYKNKYPPIGLMKLATYHRLLGDDVVFFKGSFKEFITSQITSEATKKLYKIDNKVEWYNYKDIIASYITRGLLKDLELLKDCSKSSLIENSLVYFRDYYKNKEYINSPEWDRICICTLFTFFWDKTIETINSFKTICKDIQQVWVGGIAASVLPIEMEAMTGIKPWKGLLNKHGILDDNDIIIDTLPLDYSILDEIDYVYPENNGYYGYTTRGCINKCSFCVVPLIEPKYEEYISISEAVENVRNNFGEKRSLLLLDNNVLASSRFEEIIDDIKKAGFDKECKYIEPSKYKIAIYNLKRKHNVRANIKVVVRLYKSLIEQLENSEKEEVYNKLKNNSLLNEITATKENIFSLHKFMEPYFESTNVKKPKVRYVDFNQGLEAKLLTDKKMRKLSEIPINPLRIAFDHWSLKNIYVRAIKTAAKYGIRNMSNYLLYNYNDKPLDLYRRLKLNIELCEELGINIYSFPMKYHPIIDPKYFSDRTYIGKYWNRKFIRAIQAVLNSTKGKIGRGRSFFEEAFGSNQQNFYKILYMPEALIIYREHFKKKGITGEWWDIFCSLSPEKKKIAKRIIHTNKFDNINDKIIPKDVQRLLEFYQIRRDDAI